jgi:hypothetical protein
MATNNRNTLKICKYLAAVILNELYKFEMTCNVMAHGACKKNKMFIN